jgi:hypothetical protein
MRSSVRFRAAAPLFSVSHSNSSVAFHARHAWRAGIQGGGSAGFGIATARLRSCCRWGITRMCRAARRATVGIRSRWRRVAHPCRAYEDGRAAHCPPRSSARRTAASYYAGGITWFPESGWVMPSLRQELGRLLRVKKHRISSPTSIPIADCITSFVWGVEYGSSAGKLIQHGQRDR